MKFIGGFIFSSVLNIVAILAADYFVSGFTFSGTFIELVTTAVIFAAINMVIRPIIKLFLGPFIVLTFGLFTIVINALMLYILDIVSTPLTIDGYLPLLFATLLMSVANIVVGGGARSRFKS